MSVINDVFGDGVQVKGCGVLYLCQFMWRIIQQIGMKYENIKYIQINCIMI